MDFWHLDTISMITHTLEIKAPILLSTVIDLTLYHYQCEDSVLIKVRSSYNYLENYHDIEHEL